MWPERGKIFVGDQSDVAFLEEVARDVGPFDVIIDDGSHHPEHHLISLGALFGHLRDGGLYVIEDLASCFSQRFGPGAGLGNPGSTIEWLKRLLDVIHAHPDYGGVVGDEISSRIRSLRFFPELAVLEKGPPGEPGPSAGPDRRTRPPPCAGRCPGRARSPGRRPGAKVCPPLAAPPRGPAGQGRLTRTPVPGTRRSPAGVAVGLLPAGSRVRGPGSGL